MADFSRMAVYKGFLAGGKRGLEAVKVSGVREKDHLVLEVSLCVCVCGGGGFQCEQGGL